MYKTIPERLRYFNVVEDLSQKIRTTKDNRDLTSAFIELFQDYNEKFYKENEKRINKVLTTIKDKNEEAFEKIVAETLNSNELKEDVKEYVLDKVSDLIREEVYSAVDDFNKDLSSDTDISLSYYIKKFNATVNEQRNALLSSYENLVDNTLSVFNELPKLKQKTTEEEQKQTAKKSKPQIALTKTIESVLSRINNIKTIHPIERIVEKDTIERQKETIIQPQKTTVTVETEPEKTETIQVDEGGGSNDEAYEAALNEHVAQLHVYLAKLKSFFINQKALSENINKEIKKEAEEKREKKEVSVEKETEKLEETEKENKKKVQSSNQPAQKKENLILNASKSASAAAIYNKQFEDAFSEEAQTVAEKLNLNTDKNQEDRVHNTDIIYGEEIEFLSTVHDRLTKVILEDDEIKSLETQQASKAKNKRSKLLILPVPTTDKKHTVALPTIKTKGTSRKVSDKAPLGNDRKYKAADLQDKSNARISKKSKNLIARSLNGINRFLSKHKALAYMIAIPGIAFEAGYKLGKKAVKGVFKGIFGFVKFLAKTITFLVITPLKLIGAGLIGAAKLLGIGKLFGGILNVTKKITKTIGKITKDVATLGAKAVLKSIGLFLLTPAGAFALGYFSGKIIKFVSNALFGYNFSSGAELVDHLNEKYHDVKDGVVEWVSKRLADFKRFGNEVIDIISNSTFIEFLKDFYSYVEDWVSSGSMQKFWAGFSTIMGNLVDAGKFSLRLKTAAGGARFAGGIAHGAGRFAGILKTGGKASLGLKGMGKALGVFGTMMDVAAGLYMVGAADQALTHLRKINEKTGQLTVKQEFRGMYGLESGFNTEESLSRASEHLNIDLENKNDPRTKKLTAIHNAVISEYNSINSLFDTYHILYSEYKELKDSEDESEKGLYKDEKYRVSNKFPGFVNSILTSHFGGNEHTFIKFSHFTNEFTDNDTQLKALGNVLKLRFNTLVEFGKILVDQDRLGELNNLIESSDPTKKLSEFYNQTFSFVKHGTKDLEGDTRHILLSNYKLEKKDQKDHITYHLEGVKTRAQQSFSNVPSETSGGKNINGTTASVPTMQAPSLTFSKTAVTKLTQTNTEELSDEERIKLLSEALDEFVSRKSKNGALTAYGQQDMQKLFSEFKYFRDSSDENKKKLFRQLSEENRSVWSELRDLTATTAAGGIVIKDQTDWKKGSKSDLYQLFQNTTDNTAKSRSGIAYNNLFKVEERTYQAAAADNETTKKFYTRHTALTFLDSVDSHKKRILFADFVSKIIQQLVSEYNLTVLDPRRAYIEKTLGSEKSLIFSRLANEFITDLSKSVNDFDNTFLNIVQRSNFDELNKFISTYAISSSGKLDLANANSASDFSVAAFRKIHNDTYTEFINRKLNDLNSLGNDAELFKDSFSLDKDFGGQTAMDVLRNQLKKDAQKDAQLNAALTIAFNIISDKEQEITTAKNDGAVEASKNK